MTYKAMLVGATALAAVLTFGQAANAGFTLTGGTAGLAPGSSGTNDIFASIFGGGPYPPSQITGYYGGTLTLDSGQPVIYTYVGKEAGFTNLFQVNSSTVFSTATSAVGASSTINTAAAMPFQFIADSGGGNQTVANGSGYGPGGPCGGNCSIFYTFGNTSATSGDVVYAFLDDSGAGPDDNHDDMGIKMSVVPVPAALPIIGAALAGFGFAGFRQRKAS